MKQFRLPQRIFGILILSAWTMTLFQIREWNQTSPVYFFLPVLGIFMIFGHYFIAAIGTFVARKTHIGRKVDFTFSHEGYKFEEPGATVTMSWSRILDVVIAPDGFLIRPTVHQGIWIPLTAFAVATDASQFIDLLKSANVATRRP